MNRHFRTPQEQFWAGDFGSEYIGRNEYPQLLASNIALFSRALRHAGRIESCLELGANIGMNLRALRALYPRMDLNAVEINADAVKELEKLIGAERVFAGSIFDYASPGRFDLSFTKTVLIHIHPDRLPEAYERLYTSSRRFILVCEYYSPDPVSITYRGHEDRLFKRDFAGEMLSIYPDLTLLDYGFEYRSDPAFPQADTTWFLMRKS